MTVRFDRRIYGPGPTRDSRVLLARPGRDYREDPRLGHVLAALTEVDADRVNADPAGDGTDHDAARELGEIRHVGGGMWELPDGSRVKGRDAAEAALADLADQDGTDPDDDVDPDGDDLDD